MKLFAMLNPDQKRNRTLVPAIWILLAICSGWGLVGCATLPSKQDDLVAATAGEVQTQAWENVQKLTSELGQLDARKHPGVGALVADLRRLANQVTAGTGDNYDAIDAAKLIKENPNYWRASLELAADDSTLAVLEVMVHAAAGDMEAASDLLELVRAGPLMEITLDEAVALQRRAIAAWGLNAPGLTIAMSRGLPPEEQWRPIKQAEAEYPDSPTAALAVLRMRCDLAGIELTAEGEDQRMRDKILAAEPRAMAVLEEHQPLWAAIVKASGEAGDAARRIAEMITPDNTGILNFSEDDLAKLVADFDRIGLPDWALRALRLQMGQRGETNAADMEALRQLLPSLIGEDAATQLVNDWEAGRIAQTVLHPAVPEPTGTASRPIDPVVGGHFERLRREMTALLVTGAPTDSEEEGAQIALARNQRTLGNFEAAETALAAFAARSNDKIALAQETLALAVARGDETEIAMAREALRRVDRKFKRSWFEAANAFVRAGQYREAADTFATGWKNDMADPKVRAFSALHAFGAATLAGETRTEMITDARLLVEEDAWIARLIGAQLGEVSREQLLAEAAEGRDYIATGQHCEAYFALAFAPGQTPSGRQADLESCVRTGMVGYIEYEFALAWLRRNAGWR
ncbi:hypothetical protein [Synoicihabitans lomoniglobus]|uniref:Uncharacterized protein n=1 Tax=Synoicihabitans lomoniglobus TaxID=2909285 RepID=A0AAF0CPR4_9BACT|nr:hypothetical protein [Opitutaceae bacterium LMO-M01]WED65796.1 hypothetical protein PXH66_02910 [Opitutaceae bacterium LMO-M01]